MARATVTKRPPAVQYLQWDGSNADEIEQYVAANCQINGIPLDVVRNQDGTITVNYGIYGTITINHGDWLLETGISPGVMVNPIPDATFQADNQVLTGSAPRAYDITES